MDEDIGVGCEENVFNVEEDELVEVVAVIDENDGPEQHTTLGA